MTRNVSIIIPVRNEKDFIESTLDSILSQDLEGIKVEILVADGLSDDGTREIIQEFAHENSNIVLIDNNVITSYSIHYTKLYDRDVAPNCTVVGVPAVKVSDYNSDDLIMNTK